MQRSLVFLLAATFGASACASDDSDDLGQVDVSLVGQAPSGTTYRLRNAALTIDGPGGPLAFHTEDDPNRSQINARLQSGAYTLSLAAGWHLEKIVGGMGQTVEAELLSAHPLSFQVVAGAFTPVTLRFRAGADDVGLGEGDVGISIGVEETVDGGVIDAPPPPQEIVATPAALSIPEHSSQILGVRLAQPITATVTVAVIQGSEIATSTQFLTFTPGNFNVDQTVVVTALVDDDANHESTQVILDLPGVTTRTIPVTVEDDDALYVVVGGGGSISVVEGTTHTIGVRLSAQPNQPVTVQSIIDNTTVAAVSPASMVFTPSNWNVVQMLEIAGVPDNDVVGGQAMLHVGAVGIPVVTSRLIEVTDDDAVSLVVTPSALTMSEGTTQTAQVHLSFLPPAPMTINVATSDPSRVFASPSTLTFDASNWDVPRPLTLTAATDTDQQNQTVRITLANPTLASATIDVTVVDTTVMNALGWPTTGGSTAGIPSNELQLFRVQLSAPAALDRLQVLGGGGLLGQARLAIYQEVGTSPGPLVFGGQPLQLGGPGQPTVQPVNGVTLQPGAYYIGLVTNSSVPISTPPAPQPSVTRCRQQMSFGGGFPSISPANCQPAQPLSVAAFVLQ